MLEIEREKERECVCTELSRAALIMYSGNIHNYVWLYTEWGKVMPEMGANWD